MSWGLLGGLGKGMSDYSTLLTNKREDDWKASQDELAHQRNIAMEDLRSSNMNSRQNRLMEHQDNMQESRFGHEESKLRESRDYDKRNEKNRYLNGVAITDEDYGKLTKEQQARTKTTDEYKREQAIGTAVDVKKAESNFTKEQMDAEYAEMKKQPWYDALSQKQKNAADMVMSSKSGSSLVALFADKKKDKFTGEMYKAITESLQGTKEYDEGDVAKKTKMTLGVFQVISGSASPTVTPEVLTDLALEYNSGEISKEDLLTKAKGTPYEAFAIELSKINPTNAANTANIIKAFDASKDHKEGRIRTRTPEGDPIAGRSFMESFSKIGDWFENRPYPE